MDNLRKQFLFFFFIAISFSCKTEKKSDIDYTLLEYDFSKEYSFFVKINEYQDADSIISKVEVFKVSLSDKTELIELDSLMKPYFENKITPDANLLDRYENIDLNYDSYALIYEEVFNTKKSDVIYKSRNIIWSDKERSFFLKHINQQVTF